MKTSLMKTIAVLVVVPLGIAGRAAEDWTPRLTEHGQPDAGNLVLWNQYAL